MAVRLSWTIRKILILEKMKRNHNQGQQKTVRLQKYRMCGKTPEEFTKKRGKGKEKEHETHSYMRD
jgi:hypothetical protein